MTRTLKDLAQHLKLSEMTVSRALHSPKNVSPETRERVLAAAAAMNYQPNLTARSLKTGRTNIVSVWVPDVSSSMFGKVVEGIREQAYAAQVGLMIGQTHHNLWAKSSEGVLAQWPVDGIFAYDQAELVEHALTSPHPPRTPIISMGGDYCELGDYVGIDIYAGASEAMRHLLAERRRIALLAPHYFLRTGYSHYDAYMAAMRHAGLPPEVVSLPEDSREAACRVITAYGFERGWPEAVFCTNDEIAIGALQAARDWGMRVSDDFAIIGSDGILETEYQWPPLSTVEFPIAQMCAAAWQFFQVRQAHPDHPPQQVVLSTTLHLRASS